MFCTQKKIHRSDDSDAKNMEERVKSSGGRKLSCSAEKGMRLRATPMNDDEGKHSHDNDDE